jgi:hypothetical protein
MENLIRVPQKMKIILPCEPEITLLICQREKFTPLFIMAIFTICKQCKQVTSNHKRVNSCDLLPHGEKWRSLC